MIILSILLAFVSIVLFCLLFTYKRQVKHLKNQVRFLYLRDTQKEITLTKSHSDIMELADSINLLISKNRKSGLLIEKNNLIFKDTITSLSHDLRTPLATASGYLQMLIDEDLSEKQNKYVAIAEERIRNVKLLLDQLFEFARIESNEIKFINENVDISCILRDVIASYYEDFERKEETPFIDIPSSPIKVWADKEALHRVFSNIIYNALIHGDGDYRITMKVVDTNCEIIISNSSQTIQEEDITHLFERFYTTDKSRSKKTTGLGLAITKELIIRMNGTIKANLLDKVFEIHISLPIL